MQSTTKWATRLCDALGLPADTVCSMDIRLEPQGVVWVTVDVLVESEEAMGLIVERLKAGGNMVEIYSHTSL